MSHEVIDDDDDDEFEPLFSYERVCKPPSDDDSDDDVTEIGGKQLKIKSTIFSPSLELTSPFGKREHDDFVQVLEDDDDWLPPPPKNARVIVDNKDSEDPTLREIRQAKEELKRLAESRIDDKLGQKTSSLSNESNAEAKEHKSSAGTQEASARKKVLVTIQDKDGVCKNFRQFKDEKFEKLFLKYAEMVGVSPDRLVFLFDGQKILDHNTPKDFDIEDEDIIEVNLKK
ncbi:hypothetical protein KP509_38G048800 [Ceratopteris richardii]|uniref:Ubiquitin-like domain-containing protein n=1 Tax=Ceratopteris richardii TaxID=49495 RepID=A0A8T2Q3U5_CERRI|nr:hypothetical protein KP509_38G048800 [Ceratopteris richardii]